MKNIIKEQLEEYLHAEGGAQTITIERNDRLDNSRSVQQILPREQQQQITINRETHHKILEGDEEMRHFEKIIGERFLTSNIENNEYSYQKSFGKNKKNNRNI